MLRQEDRRFLATRTLQTQRERLSTRRFDRCAFRLPLSLAPAVLARSDERPRPRSTSGRVRQNQAGLRCTVSGSRGAAAALMKK